MSERSKPHDFGFNSTGISARGEQVVEIQQRLVLNDFTAKRMLPSLGISVQRYEQAFGVLETDIQKRVIPQRTPRAAARAS